MSWGGEDVIQGNPTKERVGASTQGSPPICHGRGSTGGLPLPQGRGKGRHCTQVALVFCQTLFEVHTLLFGRLRPRAGISLLVCPHLC